MLRFRGYLQNQQTHRYRLQRSCNDNMPNKVVKYFNYSSIKYVA